VPASLLSTKFVMRTATNSLGLQLRGLQLTSFIRVTVMVKYTPI
jgi:hypothetical protein